MNGRRWQGLRGGVSAHREAGPGSGAGRRASIHALPALPLAAATLVMLGAMGCSDGGFSEALGAAQQAVVNGIEDNQQPPLYPAVVSVYPSGCTGTFITPNLILTAGHCAMCTNAKPGEACWCLSPQDKSAFCQLKPRDWAQDGWARGIVTPATPNVDTDRAFARAGLIDAPGQGAEYPIDYIWFAPAGSGGATRLDVAVMHTSVPYGGPLAPLMSRSEIITATNYQGFIGQAVTVVGYSDNGSVAQGRRRR